MKKNLDSLLFKASSRSILVGTILISLTVDTYADVRFPTPTVALQINNNGKRIPEPFDLEISCYEASSGKLWNVANKGRCTENPCKNSITSDLLLIQHNLANGYLSHCAAKATTLTGEKLFENSKLTLPNLNCNDRSAWSSDYNCSVAIDELTSK